MSVINKNLQIYASAGHQHLQMPPFKKNL